MQIDSSRVLKLGCVDEAPAQRPFNQWHKGQCSCPGIHPESVVQQYIGVLMSSGQQILGLATYY